MKKLTKKDINKRFMLDIEAYHEEYDDVREFYHTFHNIMRPIKLVGINKYNVCEFMWIEPFNLGTMWDVSFTDRKNSIKDFITPYGSTQIDVEALI